MNFRQDLESYYARFQRRLAYRAYDLAGELGQWARDIFARTAWVEPGAIQVWPYGTPVTTKTAPVSLCGECGRPLPADEHERAA
jgi:hypothetical protein